MLMKAKAIFLSLAVLAPLHVARAAMRLSVSMLNSRDQLEEKLNAGALATDQTGVGADDHTPLAIPYSPFPIGHSL